MINDKEIRARKIKAMMILKGITSTELAKRLGISKTWISLTIHGHNKSKRIRKGIADALGVPYENLWE